MIELRTERLLLRPWRHGDRALFAALNADPEVMRHFPGLLTRAQSDALVDRIERAFARDGWGLFALEELGGGDEMLGFTGLWRVPFEAHFTPAVEIGWRLARHAWGKGFATEAAHASAALAFGELGLSEIVSLAVPTNERSTAVMRRIGMQRDVDGDFDHPGLPAGSPLRRHVLYRMRAAQLRSPPCPIP